MGDLLTYDFKGEALLLALEAAFDQGARTQEVYARRKIRLILSVCSLEIWIVAVVAESFLSFKCRKHEREIASAKI